MKGLVDEIKHHLNGNTPLFILKLDETMGVTTWEDTRNALSLLECSADALLFTTTENIEWAREFCFPRREPIDYSPVGLYYDTVLALTSRQKNENSYNPQIFRDILEECKPHEFCMKIFTHAFSANPKRFQSSPTSTLQALPLPKPLELIARKVFKFSYNDLPKEYKSCLLYLAIFPPGREIRRSTLIGRWVAEGLIFHDDWPNSVHRANRCFDELIDRWLVYPADIGVTGKVKSCMVSDLVHEFITKIARKQHIVETRLSHHLARHFSIFNDLRLRSSDRIDKFFEVLSASSRVSVLKVLDLEGCQCFGGKKQRYLKVICAKMLLLKYLSLKGTDVTQLPTEISNLRELEVLDIRMTMVPESSTANVLLLKLKRLLAGQIIYPSPSSSNTGTVIARGGEISSVQIPEKIEKMLNLEVLSNVKVRRSQDLKDIGRLCQLRKLGVVVDDKGSHFKNLLQMISDVHESLRSLSITIPTPRWEGSPSEGDELQQGSLNLKLRHPPKLLESLSISGTTQKVHLLLPLFANDGNNKLVKVTLCSISLNQVNLEVFAKLPKLQCVRLRNITCAESMLTFKDGFKSLKYLLLEGCNLLSCIVFGNGAARELEKMVLSFTSIESIHGIEALEKLQELELNNNKSRLLSSFDDAKQIAKLTLRGTLLEQADLQILAKKPKMRCLVLLDKSCVVGQITFNKNEFPKLNLLAVDCSSITKIIFTGGSAPKLEKIIWSSFTVISGIDKLPRLKELEFKGDHIPKEVEETIRNSNNIIRLKHDQPDNQDQANGDAWEDGDDYARCSFC
ncbi:hypothetical protein U9M48_036665 [Paspalum notatum var. saurae]|uniref:NB-ARC domain-containing protein n=1 Tax=Paspalum notatum var. saurae TaxID=547442 RepID=A0AAQ3XAB6_PASNO